jgi:O-antigen ligase
MQKFAFLSLLFAIFSIHLPTVFMDGALILLFLFWALSGDYSFRMNLIASNVGALSALLLFILFGMSVLYASVPFYESVAGWFKYHGLLFIPIVVTMLQKKSERNLAMLTYILGALMVVLLSFGKWLDLVPMDFVRHDAGPGNFIVFRHSISQSIFIAFAIYLMMMKAKSNNGLMRALWVVAYSLSLGDILFLVDSRSAQIAMGLMIVFFLCTHWKRTYIKYLVGFAFLGIVTTYVFSPHMRLMDIENEINSAKIEHKITSSGQRLELWANTWTLIKRHPILGGGTGSFVHEYSTFVPKENIVTVLDYKNVHNQYLLTLQEVGLVGLALFLTFFFCQWKAATMIRKTFEREAFQGLIITFIITSFFNCMFWGGEAKCYYLLAGVLLSAHAAKKNKWSLRILN